MNYEIFSSDEKKIRLQRMFGDWKRKDNMSEYGRGLKWWK